MEDECRLYHLALPNDWESAAEAGEYTMSTRGVTLQDESFIHLSFAHQWPATRARFYADVERLILLEIDPTGLDIRVEVGNPATGEEFPHLYGPLPVASVVNVSALQNT